MKRIRFAILAGIVFGTLDIIPMLWMDIPDRWLAIAGAFCNRFAIGFLIPVIQLPIAGWLRGLIVGFLLSLPDAIITGAVAPIMGIGIIGGIVIGYLTERSEKEPSAEQ
jgi:MFS family permease